MKWKRNLYDWFFVVAAWVIACMGITATGIFFQHLMFRFIDIPMTPANQEYIDYFISGYQYMEGGMFGLLFGTVFYFVYWLAENTELRKKSFGKIMLIKTVLYLIGFSLVFAIVFFVLFLIDVTPVSNINDLKEVLASWPFYIAFGSILTIFSVIINFVLEVSKKYGPGNLLVMFMGKYHQPVIENRIFMFLDLKDSTAYAEKLGHIKYSSLIQTCFFYLNEIVFAHKAQIYQYVGDEAVLTWNSSDANASELSIKLFFAFRDKLHSKAAKFEQNFGFVPAFKAGINEGSVTVAEVGYIKRDIAYHGDVLNTGARIQSMCSQFNRSLLVSEHFAQATQNIKQFRQEFLGEIALKGKEKAVNIYAIEQT
ncbi:adenylate/guanylate cyclase domain-containing protein [Reichenbachiella carrageenanivorans]|uniref:Adenylate/guanylate cyclase domain-containing protein n=1 Tax=Reichenbachiella carrageenanivorans TaxID=2979869 RepID=A0ABY6D3P3_9BACT|nr:adenylate/guanylate cyclase domain-containing protein [Reichenbachiella carrageenanivorans]UXX80771.1 adenylate/guanylate cyclase domain-containing protein [Reichenbachiella carrageenanivorans]